MVASKSVLARLVIVGSIGLLFISVWGETCSAQAPGGSRIKQQEVFSGSNILSPGTKDDWPLTAKEGETVVISVSAQGFDPAVELVGPTGQILGRNDDIRQGQQDALLLIRLTQAGEYQARVVSSNPASGGRYQLTVRRFPSTELRVGGRKTEVLGKRLAQWFRFDLPAAKTLVLTARATGFRPNLEVLLPNGEPAELSRADSDRVDTFRVMFNSTQIGTCYVRVSHPNGGDPRQTFTITVAEAHTYKSTLDQPAQEPSIPAGGIDLWTFSAEAGDLIRVRTSSDSGEMAGQLSYLPPPGKANLEDTSVVPVVVLPSDTKKSGEIVALLNRKGTYQVAVSHPFGLGVTYKFAVSKTLKTLPADGAKAKLGVGQGDFWSLDGKAGQILQLDGTSTSFDVSLELYDPKGDVVARDDDGGTGRDARLLVLLTEAGRYVVRIHSKGDGGGGDYGLSRKTDPTQPIAINQSKTGTLGASGKQVWSFQGRAGQTLIISTRSTDFNARTLVYGPDGAELASDDDGGEGNDSLLSLQLAEDGTYHLWVASAAGGGKYTVQVIEAK